MYADLERPPLRAAALRRALGPDGWRVEVLERAGSTNAVVAHRAAAGEPAGLVVVAERQLSGRGRLDRSWVSPPRAGLTFSALLRPDLPTTEWGWLPLLAGVAVARAVRAQSKLDAVLKWPNDVLIAGRKVAGLLAEGVAPGGLVVGIGLNVTTTREELPHDGATSLRLEDSATTDRDTLLRAILRELATVLGDVDAGRTAYRELCSTIGQAVRVELPATSVEGLAEGVDDDGRLSVNGISYGAGDVVHLRPATAT
ncbi:MAG: BirA family transcriptional regulator [Actinomycetota bacterium]|jgi:BirA family biotin operon repressor/biotin-[acetyl-CoA-carboxylase] ligase|nr:BirA family transcriptional regulator [Actinomycetota bacterium]